jgi:hypothetical protein
MTTERQLEISVLAAPLAAIDRRGLSQAWYSALHLARDASPAPRGASCLAEAKKHANAALAPAAEAPRRALVVATQRQGGTRSSGARSAGTVERRSPRSPLARRIERAFLDPRVRATLATFATGTGDARVVVTMHGSGERVALVALCAPHARRAVARALDQARFALAARGIALHARLAGDVPCS